MKITVTGKITEVKELRTTKAGAQMHQFEIETGTTGNRWIRIIGLDIEVPQLRVGNSVSVTGDLTTDAYINKEGKAVGKLVIFADSVSVTSSAPDSETPF